MWARSRSPVFHGFGYSLSHRKLWRFIFIFQNNSILLICYMKKVNFFFEFTFDDFVLSIICARAWEAYTRRLNCLLPANQCVCRRWFYVRFFTGTKNRRYCIFVGRFCYLLSEIFQFLLVNIIRLIYNLIEIGIFFGLHLVWLWIYCSCEKHNVLTNWCIVKRMKWKILQKQCKDSKN